MLTPPHLNPQYVVGAGRVGQPGHVATRDAGEGRRGLRDQTGDRVWRGGRGVEAQLEGEGHAGPVGRVHPGNHA